MGSYFDTSYGRTHRWNIVIYDGQVYICKGDHERSQGCQPLPATPEELKIMLVEGRLEVEVRCDAELNPPEVVARNELHAQIIIRKATDVQLD